MTGGTLVAGPGATDRASVARTARKSRAEPREGDTDLLSSVHSCPYNVLPVAVSPARSRRIGIRVTEQQDALIREAASLAGETVPGFVLGTGQERARKLLDERRHLVMSDQAFADFTAALDEPGVAVPELQELFALPRIPER